MVTISSRRKRRKRMTRLKTPVNQEKTTMKKAVNQKMMVLELAI
jgi:hypothetical protein